MEKRCKVTYKKNYVVIHTFPQKARAPFEILAVLISFLNVWGFENTLLLEFPIFSVCQRSMDIFRTLLIGL